VAFGRGAREEEQKLGVKRLVLKGHAAQPDIRAAGKSSPTLSRSTQTHLPTRSCRRRQRWTAGWTGGITLSGPRLAENPVPGPV
jgi:hypothetical protein